MILVIDAGNSRVKWGRHDGHQWLQQGHVSHADMAHLEECWRALPPPNRLLISNVAGEKVRLTLAILFERWNVTPRWVEAKPFQCGVTNRYQQPEKLGSDRWAALIGAWHAFRRTCMVVNVGTAMTVDALSDQGVFMGGLIAPGPRLMVEVLAGKTAGVTHGEGSYTPFPTLSEDAVYSGAIMSLCGAIRQMHAEMIAHGQMQPLCVLSGGDASMLFPGLTAPFEHVENLVLEGLIRIAQEGPDP